MRKSHQSWPSASIAPDCIGACLPDSKQNGVPKKILVFSFWRKIQRKKCLQGFLYTERQEREGRTGTLASPGPSICRTLWLLRVARTGASKSLSEDCGETPGEVPAGRWTPPGNQPSRGSVDGSSFRGMVARIEFWGPSVIDSEDMDEPLALNPIASCVLCPGRRASSPPPPAATHMPTPRRCHRSPRPPR